MTSHHSVSWKRLAATFAFVSLVLNAEDIVNVRARQRSSRLTAMLRKRCRPLAAHRFPP
jgi:hypothetical protein